MNKKEILHSILSGMCPYISCGVPNIYWGLAESLTLEIYGSVGLELLQFTHQTYLVDNGEVFHSIQLWENDIEILPTQLIEKLEKLEKLSLII